MNPLAPDADGGGKRSLALGAPLGNLLGQNAGVGVLVGPAELFGHGPELALLVVEAHVGTPRALAGSVGRPAQVLELAVDLLPGALLVAVGPDQAQAADRKEHAGSDQHPHGEK